MIVQMLKKLIVLTRVVNLQEMVCVILVGIYAMALGTVVTTAIVDVKLALVVVTVVTAHQDTNTIYK